MVSPEMVRAYLASHLGVVEASVRCHEPKDFIVRFSRREDRETVLCTPVVNAPFSLIWHPWRRMSLATADFFQFRVLIGMRHVPLHARNADVVQTILGSSCARIELAPPEVTPVDDDREFFMAAWCQHPRLIPEEQAIFIPEPNVLIPGNALALRAGERLCSTDCPA
jgi:hypothetical protein